MYIGKKISNIIIWLFVMNIGLFHNDSIRILLSSNITSITCLYLIGLKERLVVSGRLGDFFIDKGVSRFKKIWN